MIEHLSSKMERPRNGNRLGIYTDGNDQYTCAFPRYFETSFVDYGQLVKVKDKHGRLIRKEKRIVYGHPDIKDIETTDIENSNGIFRERLGRLVRKTKCFSKKRSKLCNAIDLFQFYWNFINNFQRMGSPAMLEGIAGSVWSWHEFFHKQLTIVD